MKRAARSPALALACAIFVVTMLGTTLPTPLYPTYERTFHIEPILIPVIFALYAIAVIGGLMFFGRLSDAAGRKNVLFLGLLLSALSAVAFLTAHSLAMLFVGRLVSGLSAGIFTGTATATIVELAAPENKKTASMLAVAANTFGLALGTLLCGLVATVFAHPLRFPYAIDLVLVALAALALLAVPETVESRSGASLCLTRLQVPSDLRGVFVPAAIAGACSFAVSGLFSAIVPSFLAVVLHVTTPALTGIMVFVLFAFTAGGQIAIDALPRDRALSIASALLLVGTIVLAAAVVARSWPTMFLAAALEGCGQGVAIGFGLAQINERVKEARGEVTSTYFVVLYGTLAIPVIGVGVLAHATSLVTASLVFCGIVALTVACVLVATTPNAYRK